MDMMKYSLEERREMLKKMSKEEQHWISFYGWNYKENINWTRDMESKKLRKEWDRIIRLYLSDNFNEKYFGEHRNSMGRGWVDDKNVVFQEILFEEKYRRLRKDKKEEILKDTFKIENDLGLRIEHCWNKFGGSYVRIEMDFSELKTKTMKIGNK